MSKSKLLANDKLYYGIRYTADNANKLTNSVSPQVLSNRWKTIIGVIELVAKDGDYSAVLPFHIRTGEARKLESIGYSVNENTINWDIDLFSDEDMKDAFL